MPKPSTADATPAPADLLPRIEAASTEYVGRWNRLVSTTNWEKGRIICEWRAALIEAGAPQATYSDEAWSRSAGHVSPQHTGRLRRVFQRFSTVREGYDGLFWSHFQAALDWDDAEMWLEGAVQSGWPVAEMQAQRAKTLGMLQPPPAEPAEVWDDDAPSDSSPAAEAISGELSEVQPTDDGLDETGSQSRGASAATEESLPPSISDSYVDDGPPPPALLANVPSLPADLADAFDAFKVAIVHHRLLGWQEVRCEDVLTALEALRQVALAPGE